MLHVAYRRMCHVDHHDFFPSEKKYVKKHHTLLTLAHNILAYPSGSGFRGSPLLALTLLLVQKCALGVGCLGDDKTLTGLA